jgi:hypothetical protein
VLETAESGVKQIFFNTTEFDTSFGKIPTTYQPTSRLKYLDVRQKENRKERVAENDKAYHSFSHRFATDFGFSLSQQKFNTADASGKISRRPIYVDSSYKPTVEYASHILHYAGAPTGPFLPPAQSRVPSSAYSAAIRQLRGYPGDNASLHSPIPPATWHRLYPDAGFPMVTAAYILANSHAVGTTNAYGAPRTVFVYALETTGTIHIDKGILKDINMPD